MFAAAAIKNSFKTRAKAIRQQREEMGEKELTGWLTDGGSGIVIYAKTLLLP